MIIYYKNHIVKILEKFPKTGAKILATYTIPCHCLWFVNYHYLLCEQFILKYLKKSIYMKTLQLSYFYLFLKVDKYNNRFLFAGSNILILLLSKIFQIK